MFNTIVETDNYTSLEVNEENIILRKNWKVVQAITEQFWKSWINKHFKTLLFRKNWIK